ncbi:MAG: biotin/lipoyl-binding protein [Chloroflexi bacterium]|nr:biotin/lipoyl-binding protein [Chloroflexota bacterium]MCC6892071.1 biotin/lipoyl-binding protein [Anaerolineae bacterium]
MRYTYQYHGQTHALSVEPQANRRFRVTVGTRTLDVEAQPLADGGLRLLIDGESHIAYTAAEADKRYIHVDGAGYSLSVPNTTRRKGTSAGDGLTAQMPGQVTTIQVQAGDIVTRGQTLLILEAMKMETRVMAPADGRVTQVFVTVGEVVERGQRLADFEVQT